MSWVWLAALHYALAADREAPGAEHAETKHAYEIPRLVVAGGTSDISFPSTRIGMEFPLLVGVTNRRSKRGRLRNGVGEMFAAVDTGFWVEPRNAVPVFLVGEVGTRWTGPKGGHVGFHLGGGYVHSFNGGTTITVRDDDTVHRAPLAGQPGFLGQAALSFGYDLGKRHKPPLSIGLREGFGIIAPFNTLFLTVLRSELTFTLRLERLR